MTQSKKLISILVWTFISVLAFGGFYIYWQYSKKHPSTDDAYLQANVVNVAAEVSGKITTVYVVNNQYITKNTPLFIIDPTEYQLTVKQAMANLALAKQKVQGLIDQVAVAKANVTKAAATEGDAEKNANRILQLVATGKASKAQGDDVSATLAEAKAALIAANNQQALAEHTLGDPEHNSEVQAATAQLELAINNLSHTVVRAPTDGYVTNFNLVPGQMVNPGAPLFAFVDNSTWWVSASFKETDLSRIRTQQTASIRLDMYPDIVLPGVVDSISHGSDSSFSLLPSENATGNWVKVTQRFPVKIKITKIDSNYPLRMGASATVTVYTDK